MRFQGIKNALGASKMSTKPLVSPATRSGAHDPKATNRPLPLIDGMAEFVVGIGAVLVFVGWVIVNAHTLGGEAWAFPVDNKDVTQKPLVSPATRSGAHDVKATNRPVAADRWIE